MKFLILFIINLVCLNCSNQETDTRVNLNGNSGAHSTNTISKINSDKGLLLNGNSLPEGDLRPRGKLGDFRVDVYEDDKLAGRQYYHNGQLSNETTFNVETNIEEYETEYFYMKNGDFEKLKVTKGDASVLEDIFSRAVKDLAVQNDILKSKGIEFPLPDIASEAVSDLSLIFAIADNYIDFKTDIQKHGNRKVIKFIGFNKRSGYERASMTFRSGALPILVKDYELTLEKGYPLKELYKTDEGELAKTYSYKDGKLMRIAYQFTDLKSRTDTMEKRFEYYELK